MGRDAAKLVLIHAIGNDRDCWQFLDLAALGLDNIGIYEMPGHGRRPRQDGMTWTSMAVEIAQQFEGPLHLLAVAAGTAVAGRLLIGLPERVRSAVLVCSNEFTLQPQTPEERRKTIEKKTRRGQDAIRSGMGAVIDETFRRWFTPDALARNMGGVRYLRDVMQRMDPQAWMDVQLAGSLDEPVLTQTIEQIAQPVSLVGVLHDHGQGAANADELHGAIRRSRVHYTPGPHVLHLERPRNLLGALEQHFLWLERGAERIERSLCFSSE